MRRGLRQFPLTIDRNSGVPLQQQLMAGVCDAVARGLLRPGTSVPSVRALAEQLGVSRNTVILAYERLAAEGYLTSTPGAGTYISACLPEECLRAMSPAAPVRVAATILHPAKAELRAPGVAGSENWAVDFRLGRPAAEAFPREFWLEHSALLLRHAEHHMSRYGDPAGLPKLRAAIAEHLLPLRGIQAQAEDVVVVGGIQEALNLMAWLFLNRGDQVAVEDPCYAGGRNVFVGYGAQVTQVPVDDCGVDPAALPDGDCRLLYLTPSHQYPLGSTLDMDRRVAVLNWAQARGCYVLEDDYDADFRYREAPLPALAAMDSSGNVVYCGTFSKCLGPGLRLGYMVCPPALTPLVAEAKALLNNGSPWLSQAVLARMIQDGEFDAHLRRIRALYLRRRDALISVLAPFGGRLSGTEGGMHLAWKPPSGGRDAAYLEAALRTRGIKVYTLADATVGNGDGTVADAPLLLGYAAVPEDAIARFGAVLHDIFSGNGSAATVPMANAPSVPMGIATTEHTPAGLEARRFQPSPKGVDR